MSRSFEFCRMVAADKMRSSYADRDWSNAAEEIETVAVFDELLRGRRHLRVDTNDRSFDASISFDADADFDYFTSESCVHDGTLLFIREIMDRCVRRVCFAQTYDKRMGEPKDGETIQWVVGNFVVLTEFDGDFVPADKPWMRERTTVLLPLKMIKL